MSDTAPGKTIFPSVFHKDVRPAHKPQEEFPPGRFAVVKSDAALSGVVVEEGQATLGIWSVSDERRALASGVTVRGLHLDDICPRISQEPSA